MQKYIVLLSLIFPTFQAVASQQQTTTGQHCEKVLRSLKESVITPMRSRIQENLTAISKRLSAPMRSGILKTTRNLKTLYLLVTLTQENKEENEASSFQSAPDMSGHLSSLKRTPDLTELTKRAVRAGYRLAEPLDLNNTEAIKEKLDRKQGDGAAIIAIESLDSKTAENIRQAIYQLSEERGSYSVTYNNMLINLKHGWESWETSWHLDKLISTGKVSLSETQQFKMYIDQLAQKIKDLILKIDGKRIATYDLYLRLEVTKQTFYDGHTHDFPEEWVSVNTSALGLGSWVEKTEDGSLQKPVTLPGQALLLSEMGRNQAFSSHPEALWNISSLRKDLYSVKHGTPKAPGERLLIIISFQLAPKEENQNL